MVYLSILIYVLCAAAPSFSLKLPSTFTKCDWKNSDCLAKSIENAIRQLKNPIKEYNLPSMEPLEVPVMAITPGTIAAFAITYTNVKISGITTIKILKAEFDSAGKTLTIDGLIPEYRLDFNYEAKGKVLSKPIHGSGPGMAVLRDFHPIFDLKLDEYEKNGEKYFKIVENRFKMRVKSLNFRLDNLYDGDKAAADEINKLMNDNWRAIVIDIKSKYEEAYGNIYAAIFNDLLAKVPIRELGNIA